MIKKIATAGCASLILGLSATANAGTITTIFQDNFNGENGGVGALNYTGFSNWGVGGGTVDLIGNGYYDFLPGNGLYVDLDGSTGNAGFLTHWEDLAVGNYRLSFDLAGNQRNNAAEVTTANVGILFGDGNDASDYISLNKNDGFQTFTLDFSVTDTMIGDTASVFFNIGGVGGDNVGMLLDNVKLDLVDVPEPESIALLGLGLLGLRFARKKASN